MKKKNLFCLIISLAFGVLFAENVEIMEDKSDYSNFKNVKSPEQKDYRFGIIGGVGISTSDFGFAVTEKKTKSVFSLGVLFDRPLNSYISARIEGLYSYKGFCIKRTEKDEYSSGNKEVVTEANLSYLEFPLLFCIGTKKENLWRHYFLGGFQFSYLLSASYITNSSSGDGSQGDLAEIDNYDYGMIIGAGTTFKGRAFLELRYNMGLKDITINSKQALMEMKTFKNRTLWLAFGIRR